jgi:hypothetical protein
MKTKESLSATDFIQVTLDVPDTVHFSSREVQTAKVSQKQRENVLAAIKDLADNERSPQGTQHIIDLLENHKPSRGKINSTQLLRQIRDNGSIDFQKNVAL